MCKKNVFCLYALFLASSFLNAMQPRQTGHMAFLLGLHPRVGAESPAHMLPQELYREIFRYLLKRIEVRSENEARLTVRLECHPVDWQSQFVLGPSPVHTHRRPGARTPVPHHIIAGLARNLFGAPAHAIAAPAPVAAAVPAEEPQAHYSQIVQIPMIGLRVTVFDGAIRHRWGGCVLNSHLLEAINGIRVCRSSVVPVTENGQRLERISLL